MGAKAKLSVGTRGSKLALIQTKIATDAMRAVVPNIEVEVRVIATEGDRNQQDSLTAIGGRGVFVDEIEQRLLDGTIDLAVHSLKDLPATPPQGICLAAVLDRADVRDVLISRGGLAFDRLPANARIGSSSERRSAQLRALRSDLQHHNIRGNVDTRVRKLDDDQYDAIVVAAAGIDRLALSHRIVQHFDAAELLPAVGQGALVVECRDDDLPLMELLGALDHRATRAAVTAERAFLRALGGGCELPIAALAMATDGELRLDGLVARADGGRIVRDTIAGASAQAETLGTALAEQVLRQGAGEILGGPR